MTDVIGAGEATVIKILEKILPSDYHIKTQVHIEKLIRKKDFELLDEEFNKHKVDVVIYYWKPYGRGYVKETPLVVVPVQGYDHTSGKTGMKHWQKSGKDKIYFKLFKDAKLKIVPILFNECPNIFKERYNIEAVGELCTMFKMAKVKL